jgi:hypothetical protein
VLLSTDLSVAGAGAHHAVARLARTCPVQLTTVHVSARERWPTQRALEAFAAKGTHVSRCVLVRGHDAVGAVADLCNSERFDLVVAPASLRHGLPLPWASFRVQLLRRTSLPLWTGGSPASPVSVERPVRTIACYVDFDDNPDGMIEAAAAFAARVGARVGAVSVVPPLDDGTIADIATSMTPLTPGCARRRMHALASYYGVEDVAAAIGERGPELQRLLLGMDADLLLVGRRQAAIGSLGFRLPRDLDRLPCPVLCIDAAATGPGWCLPRPVDTATSLTDLRSIAAAAMARGTTVPAR